MNKAANDLPLSPYRVLDLTDEKGYFCGKILADLGADVLKIEPPGGDPGRDNGPFSGGEPDRNRSLYYLAYNTNKRSLTLNLEDDEGQEIFKKLVKTADFIIESHTPGCLAGLGLDYAALRDINPGVVMVSITPFGQTGPYKDWKASDIVAIAMGGLSHITGSPDRPPVRVGVDQAYVVAGTQAAMGAMIAHYHRRATGEGQHVDTSIQQSVLISALTVPQSYDLQGYVWPRNGAFIPRSGKKMRHLWPCKDGYIAWRLFGGGLGVKTRALVDWMDSEGMAGDLAAVDWMQMDIISVSPEQYHAWQDVFAAFFKTHTKAEICREALARGIVLFPASTPQDLLADTQLEAREFWKEVAYPELGTITYPGGLYQSTGIDWELRRAPSIGEHNREVLHEEMGLSEEKINTLQQNGII